MPSWGRAPPLRIYNLAWKSVMTPWWAASSLKPVFICSVMYHIPIFPSSPAFLILVNHLSFFLILIGVIILRPALLSYILFSPSPQIILPMFVLVETSKWEMLDAMETICLQNVVHHLAGDVAPGCIFSVSRIVSSFPHIYGNRRRLKSGGRGSIFLHSIFVREYSLI